MPCTALAHKTSDRYDMTQHNKMGQDREVQDGRTGVATRDKRIGKGERTRGEKDTQQYK